ncbi:TetR family transcriptional regulator [Alcanivorax xiamenensis]|uniref:TetR family transcriptional regulator n=1 Tax=Alcanivorax xiamenensis TaxID=1177156 RepID=A0ABQ6Y9C5_9GAMM|nr:TetR/AcrR family transcriptional regulator [Alcanivorax xiamenensis]KAF0805921.1 TetR family transcriptional regulator [Alcanivorax xiamenensis]
MRAKLLAVTERLIYTGGIHATGMDRIVRESGVARKSIYRYFPTKEALVAEALRERDERWMNWFVSACETAPPGPPRLRAIFEALADWFSQDDFNGCAFINAAGEVAAGPVHDVARAHKRRLRDYLCSVLAECGVTDAATAAEDLLILVDGAIISARVGGDSRAAQRAARMAHQLVRDQNVSSTTGDSL